MGCACGCGTGGAHRGRSVSSGRRGGGDELESAPAPEPELGCAVLLRKRALLVSSCARCCVIARKRGPPSNSARSRAWTAAWPSTTESESGSDSEEDSSTLDLFEEDSSTLDLVEEDCFVSVIRECSSSEADLLIKASCFDARLAGIRTTRARTARTYTSRQMDSTACQCRL